MQPKNKSDDLPAETRRTFIEQARREQIIAATIDVLAEYGYVNTSFARIAQQAGISTGLISYHFKNKDELTREVLAATSRKRNAHVQQKLASAKSAAEQLRVAVEADLAHMGTRPHDFKAMVEVMFNLRDDNGSMVYLGNEDDPSLVTIRRILQEGQKSKEFGAFDAENLALIIDAARDTFLAQLSTRPSLKLEAFTETLVALALGAATAGVHTYADKS